MHSSIQVVIAKAKQRLRMSDTSSADADLMVLALEGLRQLAPIDMYVMKQATLDVEDNKIDLPCDYTRFVALRLSGTITDNEGNSVNSCYKLLYVDTDFLYKEGCDCSGDSISSAHTTFKINGTQIWFNNSINAEECILTYYGLATDCDGYPIVKEDWELALTMYCCSNYARSFVVTSLDQGGYVSSQVEWWEAKWVAQIKLEVRL